MRFCIRAFLMGTLGLLVACSSHGAIPTTGSSAPAGPDRHHKRAHVRLVIKVPRHKHHRRPHFVSPSTASLSYKIDGGDAVNVDISTKNSDCATSGGVLICTIEIATTVGQHTFLFETFDADSNLLSANTNLVYNVQSGDANQIPVVLGGYAASLLVMRPVSPSVTGNQDNGFTIYGNEPHNFYAVPVDADDNVIVGPGAPTPVIQATPDNMTLATPKPGSPGLFGLTSTYQSTNPTVSASSTLSIIATPVPNSGGHTVSASVPLTLYQPWIYVTDWLASKVYAYDEQGNAKTLTGQFPFCQSSYAGSCVQHANGIWYDGFNGSLYVTHNSQFVSTFDVEGTWKPLSYTGGKGFQSSPGFTNTYKIAQDPSSGRLFISNLDTGGFILEYDEFGLQYGGVVGGNNPYYDNAKPSGLAWAEGKLFTLDLGFCGVVAPSMRIFDINGNYVGAFGNISCSASDMSYDQNNGYLYVVAGNTDNAAAAYDTSGSVQVSGTDCFTNLVDPHGILADPYNGLIYIANADGSVKACTEEGHPYPIAGSFSGLQDAVGITVVK